MGRTKLSSKEIGSVQRNDFDTTTTGEAVIAKAIPGRGIAFSSTGVDAGTGDVTIKLAAPSPQTVTSASTVTADADADDFVIITAQAAALTLANPTGSPVQGQMIIYRIKDNGTARGISYGTKFRSFGAAKPGTTSVSKTLYIPTIYNSTDDKWDVLPASEEQ